MIQKNLHNLQNISPFKAGYSCHLSLDAENWIDSTITVVCFTEIGQGWGPMVLNSEAEYNLFQEQQVMWTFNHKVGLGGSTNHNSSTSFPFSKYLPNDTGNIWYENHNPIIIAKEKKINQFERDNPYHFFRSNQQMAYVKIYSWTGAFWRKPRIPIVWTGCFYNFLLDSVLLDILVPLN